MCRAVPVWLRVHRPEWALSHHSPHGQVLHDTHHRPQLHAWWRTFRPSWHWQNRDHQGPCQISWTPMCGVQLRYERLCLLLKHHERHVYCQVLAKHVLKNEILESLSVKVLSSPGMTASSHAHGRPSAPGNGHTVGETVHQKCVHRRTEIRLHR